MINLWFRGKTSKVQIKNFLGLDKKNCMFR